MSLEVDKSTMAYEAENWHEGSPWASTDEFRGQRSKVKVTRPLNAVAENQRYLRNRKAYELQTWYTDGVYDDPHHRHAR